jgi:hypothetical protein
MTDAPDAGRTQHALALAVDLGIVVAALIHITKESPAALARAHGAKGLTKNVLILCTGGWRQPA